MIKTILTYYAAQLEEYLMRFYHQPEGLVCVGLIGADTSENSNKMVVSVVNLEREASGDSMYMQRSTGGFTGSAPPLMLNLHIILAAVYDEKRYAESLSVPADMLSAGIEPRNMIRIFFDRLWQTLERNTIKDK